MIKKRNIKDNTSNNYSAEEMRKIEDKWCSFCEKLCKVEPMLGGRRVCPNVHIRIHEDDTEEIVQSGSYGLYLVTVKTTYKNHMDKITKRF